MARQHFNNPGAVSNAYYARVLEAAKLQGVPPFHSCDLDGHVFAIGASMCIYCPAKNVALTETLSRVARAGTTTEPE